MTSPGRQVAPASPTVTGVLAAADLVPGQRVADRYMVERLLGMGGMGVVYLAHDTELDVDVALKVLRPDLAHRDQAFDRFRQELLLARQVSSPHVVRIHDLVRHGDAWLISMDFVPGESLEQRLTERGHLSAEEALAITRQLALGLQAAHQRNVVHRDLKPANVLIKPDGEALITDFGVARSAGRTGLTASGMIVGTPEYLSPEQARADPIDARSDLYALGLLLYEMLTGTLPFRGGTPAEMLAQRIMRNPPPPSLAGTTLPTFAVQLCSRLLELKATRRLQSAEEVVKAIDSGRLPGVAGQRIPYLLAAALFGLAVLGGQRWYAQRAVTPTPVSAPAAGAKIDVMSLPFVVDSRNADDVALGNGIWRYLLLRHAGDSALLHDAVRARRGLAELGYDSATARNYRDRTMDQLKAQRLLEGTLRRDGQKIRVELALFDHARPDPEWTAATPWSVEAELPASLASLVGKLQAHLGERTAQGDWPGSDVLRRVGVLTEQPKAVPDSTLLEAARNTRDATLWQLTLNAYDRSGQSSPGMAAAREAMDALDKQGDLPAIEARGYAAQLLGDPARAATEWRRAIEKAPDDLPSLVMLARALGDSGELDEADTILQRVVVADPRNADAWYALGKFAIMQGNHKRAVDDYLVHAMVLANRYEDDRMRADVTNALGLGYRHLGQLDPAIEHLERAVRLRGALGDIRGQATSLRNLATAQAIQGHFDLSKASLAQARTILTPLHDPTAMAGLTNDEGVLAEERGDYAAALAAYREALSFRQTIGEPRDVGESLLNVGFTYYQLGEFDNAQVFWQQAATTYAGIDDPGGNVRAQQNLALAQIARGEFAQARQALDASLAQAEQQQMAEERAVSLATLAELDRLEGHYASALERATQAQELFAHAKDTRGTNEMLLLRGNALADIGDWDAAHSIMTRFDPKAAGSEQAAQFEILQSALALGRGAVAESLAAADRAVSTARESHGLALQLAALLRRASVLSIQGQAAAAQAELEKARAIRKRYASVPLQLELAATAVAIDAAHASQDYGVAVSLLARLPSYGRALSLHGTAATAHGLSAAERKQALARAEAVRSSLLAQLPADHLAAFQRYVASLNLPPQGGP